MGHGKYAVLELSATLRCIQYIVYINSIEDILLTGSAHAVCLNVEQWIDNLTN